MPPNSRQQSTKKTTGKSKDSGHGFVLSSVHRLAWRPSRRLSPSQWAETFRTIELSATPGPFRHENNPVFQHLHDLCADPSIEEITLVKSAQVGGSEWLRNVIGYFAHQDPDPMLLVLPDEQTGRKVMYERIMPLFERTPAIAQLMTRADDDVTLNRIRLANGFRLGLGWSGSPSSLASDPCRVVIFDEVDKYKDYSGKEADPLSLGRLRTQTYEGRRLIINVSTPTTAEGQIWRRYQQMDRYIKFVVPCPHCGERQPLAFGNLKWPKFEARNSQELATMIEMEGAAWFVCTSCGENIEELHRLAALRGGQWIHDGPAHGKKIGVGPIWAAHSTRIPWYRIAAEFVRSKDDPILLMNFTNGWLGEPFHQQVVRGDAKIISNKARTGASPRIVPDWAVAVIATADTQKHNFNYVVRAWGHGFRSQRIDHGVCRSFAELRAKTIDARYPWDGPARAPASPIVLGIDSGGTRDDDAAESRTHEVYRFAMADQRIWPIKGFGGRRDMPTKRKLVTYRPGGGIDPFPVYLMLVDVGHFKNLLSYSIGAQIDGEDKWLLDNEDDDDYARQMASEHKVIVRKAGREIAQWVPISAGAPNHYWDCEVYQFAVAYEARIDVMAPPPILQPSQTPRPPAYNRQLPPRPPFRRDY